MRSGAAAVLVGMDAVDRAIAECEGGKSDRLALRGFEQPILQANAKVREALMPVVEQVYDSYWKAWIETCRKMGRSCLDAVAELGE